MSDGVAAGSHDIGLEVQKLRASAVGSGIVKATQDPLRDMFTVEVKPSAIVEAATVLKNDPALDYALLADLLGVDLPQDDRRFHIIYNFYSVSRRRRIFLRVRVAEGEEIPTLSGVYAAADWAEREVMDLFGVRFKDHPDPRPLLLPDGWEGYPLRKDYPLVGREPVILYNDVRDVL